MGTKQIFSWGPKIWGTSGLPRRVVVEQDEETGAITIQANIVEMPPLVAAEMAAKISTASFPYEPRSHAPLPPAKPLYKQLLDLGVRDGEAEQRRGVRAAMITERYAVVAENSPLKLPDDGVVPSPLDGHDPSKGM